MEQVFTWDLTEFAPQQASDTAELADTARSLRKILAGDMTTREKQIWHMLFEKGFTLRECGVHLGVTESRVSQLRDKLLKRLRARV